MLTYEIETEDCKGKRAKQGEYPVQPAEDTVQEGCDWWGNEDIEQHLQEPKKGEACSNDPNCKLQPEAQHRHSPCIPWVSSLQELDT